MRAAGDDFVLGRRALTGSAPSVVSAGAAKAAARPVLECGYDIRVVHGISDHCEVPTAMICTHALNRGGRGVRSPLDSGCRPLAHEATHAHARAHGETKPRDSASSERPR